MTEPTPTPPTPAEDLTGVITERVKLLADQANLSLVDQVNAKDWATDIGTPRLLQHQADRRQRRHVVRRDAVAPHRAGHELARLLLAQVLGRVGTSATRQRHEGGGRLMSPTQPVGSTLITEGEDDWSLTIGGPSAKVVLNGLDVDPAKLRAPIVVTRRHGRAIVELAFLDAQLLVHDVDGTTHTLLDGQLTITRTEPKELTS